jgi:hypothetical protein
VTDRGPERRKLSIASALAIGTCAVASVLALAPDQSPRAQAVGLVGSFQAPLAFVEHEPGFPGALGFAARRFLTWNRRTVWRGRFDLPPGRHALRVVADGVVWGDGARRDGPPLLFSLDGPKTLTVLFDEDARVIGLEGRRPIVTAVGSFQTHLGCARNGQLDCVRSWLQDPDGDGVATLATQLLPAGTYEARVVVDGAEAPAAATFRVPADHDEVNLRYDGVRRKLEVRLGRVAELAE